MSTKILTNGSITMDSRPFEEEYEQSLIVIYDFSNNHVKSKIKRESQKIINKIEEKDVHIARHELLHKPNFLMLSLVNTNLDIVSIKTLHDAARELDIYEDMIVSTVEIDKIVRYEAELERE